MAWTDETKAKAVKMYTEGSPTPTNSSELCKEIADELEESPNGVRMILMQAGVYVKKDVAQAASKTGEKASTGTKRVSKEDSIKALADAIAAKGKDVDQEILDKLTGKAAIYLLSVITD